MQCLELTLVTPHKRRWGSPTDAPAVMRSNDNNDYHLLLPVV